MEGVLRRRRQWPATAGLALALASANVSGIAAGAGTGSQQDAAVKAAFLFNFAKFAEWTAILPAAPIIACVIGDDEIAAALVVIVRGQTVAGHPIHVWRPEEANSWRTCHLLFVPAAEFRRGAERLGMLKMLPVLTVSDRKGFAQSEGIIELYVEEERVRFAINVDALERSGVRLSSRLLGLAKIIRDRHDQ